MGSYNYTLIKEKLPEGRLYETDFQGGYVMNWTREPLVHFLVLGVLMFGLFALVNDEASSRPPNRIEITVSNVERLREVWSKQWNRPPTETELKGLIESHLREEILYREGLALGLDQNDTIIRRRIAQKMKFLFEDLADQVKPTHEELKDYFDRNQNQYRFPARFSFTHVYFSVDQRGNSAVPDARRLLAQLQTSDAARLPVSDRGDPFMLQYDFVRKTEQEVAKLFGQRFAEQLLESPEGSWQGPIESGYGLHLVRIHDKVEPRLPELNEVRDRVQTNLVSERRRETNEQVYQRLKARYEIVVVPFTETFDVVQK